jgi:hypothetical protein
MPERRRDDRRQDIIRGGDRRVANLGLPTGTERRSGEDRRLRDRRTVERRRGAAAGKG